MSLAPSGSSTTRRFDAIITRDLGIAAMLLRLPRGLRPPLVYESHGYTPAVSGAMPQLLGRRRPPSRSKLARLAAQRTSCVARGRGIHHDYASAGRRADATASADERSSW